MTKKENNKGISVIFILLFIAIVLGGAMYLVWKNTSQFSSSISDVGNQNLQLPDFATPAATPTPKPTIYPLVPDNGTAGTYQVSQPKHEGPTFRQIVFDPLDAHKGDVLKITISVESESGVQSLTGNFQMDSSQSPVIFKKLSRQGILDTWIAEFKLTDSVFYKYILNLSAKDSKGTSSMTIAPRS